VNEAEALAEGPLLHPKARSGSAHPKYLEGIRM